MIETRLYLYDSSKEQNGYRGENLSKYIAQADTYTEDITQELDTAEIMLMGYPVQKEFAPETKFILDKVEVQIVGNTIIDEEIINSYHLCVDIDSVSKPILSNDEYFDHHISFIEPSVVAQKRLVDNISATYKLKDVTLETRPSFDLSRETQFVNTKSKFSVTSNWGYQSDSNFWRNAFYNRWGKYFAFEGQIQMLKSTETTSGTTKFYNDVVNYSNNGSYRAKFLLPKLAIYFGKDKSTSFTKIGYASIDYTIQEFSLLNQTTPERTWNGTIHSNSKFETPTENTKYSYDLNLSIPMPSVSVRNHWLNENISYTDSAPLVDGRRIRTYYAEIKQYSIESDTTPNYLTQEIDIFPDKIYKVFVSLHNYSNSIPSGQKQLKLFSGTPAKTCTHFAKSGFLPTQRASYSFEITRTIFNVGAELSANSSFQTYSTDSISILLQSATPYSALSLLQKAVINSGLYEKVSGVYIGDLNARENNSADGKLLSNIPFYVDEEFVEELKNVSVIENFYNQKNLWEILCEIGHYIHAVPEIKFGEDDRFMITFNKLGRTDEKQHKGTVQSVMNFNGVEDYISACSSYITNMVQLGGYIDEWVAPKTTNEEFLVYNDTVEIIGTKPIIELLKVEIKANKDYTFTNGTISSGSIADITQFIFEKNVYHLLSILPTDFPNQGVSLYYSLGDNKITGCDYRTPTVNTGDKQNDYAIKKVIYSAFLGYSADLSGKNVWSNIYVNDFTFHLVYRTKDTVRQNQTRPDLRKYILNSKYDRVPQHNQFNNQTDTVVDSAKFGNMIYGKLIRTGNSQYKMIEWCNKLSELKHKGELYRIDGELYYVAKVKNTYFVDHIISEVQYSKDYNQLSPIIGIPSEPRFYEISEQSQIQREVVLNDYIIATDDISKIDGEARNCFLKTIVHLSQLMFGGPNADFAKFALTIFKGDKDIDSQGNNTLGEGDFYKEILTPINAYSSENTLTYEWDMVDNLSAGNKVLSGDETNALAPGINIVDKAYRAMRAVQYTDIFGKASLLDFALLENIPELTQEQIMDMPENPIPLNGEDGKPSLKDIEILATNIKDLDDKDVNNRGIALLKDCREIISINYNEELITSSDTFVVSPFLFEPNKVNVKIVLLTEEVNKLSFGYIDNNNIIRPKDINGNLLPSKYLNFTPSYNNQYPIFSIGIKNILSQINDNHFKDLEGDIFTEFQRVKSIAIIYDIVENQQEELGGTAFVPFKNKFIFARNLPSYFTKEQCIKDWIFGPPNKEIVFNKHQ